MINRLSRKWGRCVSRWLCRADVAAAARAEVEPLEPRLLMTATATGSVDDQALTSPVSNQVVASLTTLFDDPEITGSVVRFDTVLGTYFINLFDTVTPITVNNFLSYVTDGDYNDPTTGDNFIHRSVPGFVIQGGGFNWNGTAVAGVALDSPIINEFANHAIVNGFNASVTQGNAVVTLPNGTDLSAVHAGDRIRLIGRTDGIGSTNGADGSDFFNIASVNDAADQVTLTVAPVGAGASNISWFITDDVNVRGTLSMAKVGGDPNSATSQYFVNLANNATNLDVQNQGFTTFANVIHDGMTVVDAIAALPRYNAGSPFNEIPLINYTGGSVTTNNLVRLTDVALVDPSTYLTYTIESSNPGVATANISGGNVRISTTAATAGATTITVTATDLSGNEATVTFDVIIPGISIDDINVAEDGGSAMVTLRLSHAVDHAVSVTYTTQQDTAMPGVDYTTTTDTATFTAGQTVRVVSIPLIDNSDAEAPRSFNVNLSNPQNALLTDALGRVTIVDDDAINIDIDASTAAQPLTDGLLIIRHLAGFSGSVLTSGAIGSGATRTDPAQISARLTEMSASVLDIDGDGTVQPLTDGILIIRYLAGFSGTVLTSGALGNGATRTDPAAIVAYLDTLQPLMSQPPLMAESLPPTPAPLIAEEPPVAPGSNGSPDAGTGEGVSPGSTARDPKVPTLRALALMVGDSITPPRPTTPQWTLDSPLHAYLGIGPDRDDTGPRIDLLRKREPLVVR
ncbi:MAG: hypothetical protein GC159_24245 [Phycisphaera sp.]|nr:hypothetical protein [Phycisphaera sp.]